MKNKILLSLVCGLLIVGLATGCGNSKNDDNLKEPEENSTSTSNNSTSKKELIYNSTEAFDYLEVDGGITIIEFKNYDRVKYSKIIIPSEIDNKKVIGIGSLEKVDYIVFGDFDSPCEIVVPDTVTYIGGRSFFGVKNLIKVSGGENVKTIGDYAFADCEDLEEITFINNVTSISNSAFTGCTKWKTNN